MQHETFPFKGREARFACAGGVDANGAETIN
jgi:hypothetical protein